MEEFVVKADEEQPHDHDLFLNRLRHIPRPERLTYLLIFASVLILPLAVVNLQNRQDALQGSASIVEVSPEPLLTETDQTAALKGLKRKGLAMSQTQFPEDRALLNIDWWYVWNWGCPQDDPTCINMLYTVDDPLDTTMCKKYILFLNEPNNEPPYGGPTTPAAAAKRFIELEKICPPPTTQFVVGNVAAWVMDSQKLGPVWLTNFLNEYKSRSGKDFSQILGVHCYAYGDPTNLTLCVGDISYLKDMRNVYSGPMWVTEFNTVDEDLSYTKGFKDMLHYVDQNFERFAVYTNRQEAGAGWAIDPSVELVSSSGTLQPKGKVYSKYLLPSPSPTPTPTATPKPSPTVAPGGTTIVSIAAEDGQVLESQETSNTGGAINSTNTIFKVGDNAGDKQFKGILSFDTSVLPDSAVITSVKLKIRRQSVTGTDPFTTHGQLVLDLKKGKFGTATLEKTDFEAAATLTKIASFTKPTANGQWAEAMLPESAYSTIHLTGKTQVRVYFTKDDDDDLKSDVVNFTSSDHTTTSYRPVLEVTYQ